MSLSVHIVRQPDEDALATLHDALETEIRLTFGAEPTDGADYHVLVCGRPDRAHLTASPNLHAVVVPWAGVPPETRTLLLAFPHIALHNLHFPAVPVAEGAVALMLAAAKHVLPADRGLRRGDWSVRYDGPSGMLLHGKTALILGYGSIGQRVARICRALDMRVIATQRTITQATRNDGIEVHPGAALHDLLPRADVVIVCLPLTPETEGVIGARELALLPPGAVLVNVGRGPVVDEAALYDALKTGALGAAGIDVWYTYPADDAASERTFPSRYPLHELENVVMSPHRTGASDGTERLRMEELARLLNAIASGRPAPNRVDLQAGY